MEREEFKDGLKFIGDRLNDIIFTIKLYSDSADLSKEQEQVFSKFRDIVGTGKLIIYNYNKKNEN